MAYTTSPRVEIKRYGAVRDSRVTPDGLPIYWSGRHRVFIVFRPHGAQYRIETYRTCPCS